jgi:hypothetical protein
MNFRRWNYDYLIMGKIYKINKSNILHSFRFRQSLRTFPVILSNNYPRISGKMSFFIVDKSFICNRFFER